MSDGATKQPASPSTEPVDLSVVIPVYNKEGVIANTLQQVCRYVSQSDLSMEVIVVDDASPDASGEIVQAFIDKDDSSRFILLTNETNRRKGGAVKRGVMAAKGWAIAFIDADYAYPVEQLDRFVAEISAEADVVLGNRIDPESRYLVRPTSLHYIYHRYLIGRTFNLLVRSLLVRGIADTQCGIKCFRAEAARDIFGSMTVTNFAFDVEVIYIALKRGYRIAQVPVTYDYIDEPSSVQLCQDSIRMLRALAGIWMNGKRGVYDHNNAAEGGA